MKVKVKLNTQNINYLKTIAQEALIETADATKNDLINSQTMPFDTGAMQNRSTFIDSSKKAKGKVSIVSDTPYARKMYYHPEYNFKKDKNPNAGGMWFEPYIDGNKKNFCQNAFKRILGNKLK